MPFWIGVASRDHVLTGVSGGFCQLGHGAAAGLRRLGPGNWLVYYSPRSALEGGTPLQAFTALGRIKNGPPYQVTLPSGLSPWRRAVDFLPAREASIRPLLDRLGLTAGNPRWGIHFRRSLLAVTEPDFLIIADAMGVGDAVRSA